MTKLSTQFFLLVIVLGIFTTAVVRAEGKKSSGAPLRERLIQALILKESRSLKCPNGDDWAIGDNHLANKAYGCLQIRQPCLDDVNRVWGTNYQAKDLLGNRALSIRVCRQYLSLYAPRGASNEVLARIWNGGPKGWKKPSTRVYGQKVKALMTRR